VDAHGSQFAATRDLIVHCCGIVWRLQECVKLGIEGANIRLELRALGSLIPDKFEEVQWAAQCAAVPHISVTHQHAVCL